MGIFDMLQKGLPDWHLLLNKNFNAAQAKFDGLDTQMSNKVSKTEIIPVSRGGTGKATQVDAWNALSNMTNGYALPLDLDTITQPGFYGCGGGSTHLPEGAVYGNMLVMPYRLTDRIDPVQLFFAHNTPGRDIDEKWHYRLFRGSYSSPAWSEWTTLAIAKQPRRYDVPYSTGFARWTWSEAIESYYCKTQEGIVIGSIACEKTDGTDIACCTQVAVLPVGFRPKNYSFIPGVFRDVNGSYKGLGAMTIGTNGSIQCHYSTAGCNKFIAPFCFLAK